MRAMFLTAGYAGLRKVKLDPGVKHGFYKNDKFCLSQRRRVHREGLTSAVKL